MWRLSDGSEDMPANANGGHTYENNEDKMATAAVVLSNRILLTAGHTVCNPADREMVQ